MSDLVPSPGQPGPPPSALALLSDPAGGSMTQRGDAVTVVVRAFEPVAEEEMPFYETGWFAGLVRQGSALIAVLLVLLFTVRPLMRMLRGKDPAEAVDSESSPEGEEQDQPASEDLAHTVGNIVDRERLDAKVGLARRMVSEQPDSAVAALRLMLNEDAARKSAPEAEAAA